MEANQSLLRSCTTCGKLFFDETKLREHKRKEHSVPLTPSLLALQEREQAQREQENLAQQEQESLAQQEQEHLAQQELNNLASREDEHPVRQENEAKPPLYWLKVKNIFWPCKVKSYQNQGNNEQEVVRVAIFNDEETELDVEVVKMKLFGPLQKIPRARTAEWRRAYERALANLE